MDKKKVSNLAYQTLRKKAEQIVSEKQIDVDDANSLDLMSLIHEVEIQHVELELQNQELRKALHELEDSRNNFFELYQTAPVAFITVDANGMIEQVNTTAARLLAEEDVYLVGRPFAALIAPELHQTYFNFLKNQVLRRSISSCELRLKGGGSAAVNILLEARALYDEEGKHCQWRFGIIDISELKRVEAELRNTKDQLEDRVALRTTELNNRNKQLAQLTTELTLAEQRERHRLADLLHDHLQQFLAGARMNLEIASREKGPLQDTALKRSFELVTQSLETSRTLSAELSPPVLYMHGLTDALHWLARWMEKTHKLHVNVQAEANIDPAQEELKILLFQSVRELLFNVVKHAGINAAQIEIKETDHQIEIVVSDQGVGFDPDSIWKNDSQADNAYGLFNIRERLLLLGGDFSIQSLPQKGTGVKMMVPLHTPAFDLPVQKTDPDILVHPSNSNFKPVSPNGSDTSIRLMVVDDHAVIRQSLSSVLSETGFIKIVGEAADGVQAIEAALRINPDVILMDISMPVMDGIEATRQIHEKMPHIRIIILTMHEAEDLSSRALSAGAAAYMSKTSSLDKILSVIHQ